MAVVTSDCHVICARESRTAEEQTRMSVACEHNSPPITHPHTCASESLAPKMPTRMDGVKTFVL